MMFVHLVIRATNFLFFMFNILFKNENLQALDILLGIFFAVVYSFTFILLLEFFYRSEGILEVLNNTLTMDLKLSKSSNVRTSSIFNCFEGNIRQTDKLTILRNRYNVYYFIFYLNNTEKLFEKKMGIDYADKDGLETLVKLAVVAPVLTTLFTPAAHMVLSKLSLFLLHGGTLFTSLIPRVIMGLIYTYIYSVDWLVGVFILLAVLLFVNLTSKWIQEMIWYF